SETVELPTRDVVTAEELVQEPVQTEPEAVAAPVNSELTSLESELATLGFDTIDDEPDEEADMFFSADDVADANATVVDENSDELKQEEVMSIDDLQKDLFGTDAEDAGMEATRKIDKFYTLYRKNEEFQQLLDEEYKKLQDGSADYTLMEDVLAEYQDEEEEETPVEAHHETVEAVVKAESAKLEAARQEVGSELSNSANVTEPITAATTLVSSPAQAAVNTASNAGTIAPSVIDDDDEESRKGGVLTVIAVIVAILLVMLLVVILILNFAPDSSIAQRISEIIGKFTNFASLGDNSELLL
ncbi:hypothetical protein, partial [Mogibacterium pumilum]|uniref:hypothetical protein n=1 Tax=Mogibacterium pumilum TaxID=86332 RepID=UPI001469E599